MKSYYLFVLLSCSGYIAAQSPGAVPGITVWLKNDVRNTLNPFSTAETNPTGKVSPRFGLLNYNPVFQFNGINDPVFFPVRVSDLSQATVFIVYQESEPGAEQNVWKLSGPSAFLTLTTKKFNDITGEFSYETSPPKSAVINTYIKNWKTEKMGGLDSLILGNEAGTTSFKGKIAEYILYDRVLKRSEQRKIETYLAIKYGVSLKHDYISCSGKSIWTYKNNPGYNHRITGIGRDEQGSLYQKQSESKEERFSLAIGASVLANSNSENTNPINENDFLVFGDNDRELVIENIGGKNEPILLSKRRWLMNVSGISANKLPTELRIDISKVLSGDLSLDNYVLAIDRGGKGDFFPDDTEYITANELSNHGILTFKNIFWDTDGSGKDIFSFGINPEKKSITGSVRGQYGEGIELYPNPSSNGNYVLNVYLKKPAHVQVNIFDEAGRLIQSLSGNDQSSYRFNGKIPGSSGVYSFHITTPYQKTTRQLVVR